MASALGWSHDGVYEGYTSAALAVKVFVTGRIVTTVTAPARLLESRQKSSRACSVATCQWSTSLPILGDLYICAPRSTSTVSS